MSALQTQHRSTHPSRATLSPSELIEAKRRAGRKGGKISGRLHRERGTGIFAEGEQSRGGKELVRLHRGIHGRSDAQKVEDARKGGKASQAFRENNPPPSFMDCRRGGQIVCHMRHHVARNIRNPKNCQICREEEDTLQSLS